MPRRSRSPNRSATGTWPHFHVYFARPWALRRGPIAKRLAARASRQPISQPRMAQVGSGAHSRPLPFRPAKVRRRDSRRKIERVLLQMLTAALGPGCVKKPWGGDAASTALVLALPIGENCLNLFSDAGE